MNIAAHPPLIHSQSGGKGLHVETDRYNNPRNSSIQVSTAVSSLVTTDNPPKQRNNPSADQLDDGNGPTTTSSSPPNHNKLQSYEERLKTFRHWTGLVAPADLAHAGFYCIGIRDLVRCYICRIEIGQWEKHDIPLKDHSNWSPTCQLAQQLTRDLASGSGGSGSSSSGFGGRASSMDDIPRRETQSQDTCGKYGVHYSENSFPENCNAVLKSDIELTQIGVQPIKRAEYPQYAVLRVRLNTFRDWPVSLAQRPDDLAEAGFFYTGKSDQAVCFQCGGGLKDWEATDKPWEQHAKWFSKCPFLNLQKSAEFIASQQNNDDGEEDDESKKSTKPATTTTTTAENNCEETAVLSKPGALVATGGKKETPEDQPNSVLCKICYSKEVGVVFLPCGHMVACIDCAPALQTCAVCRKEVSAHIRAFLS